MPAMPAISAMSAMLAKARGYVHHVGVHEQNVARSPVSLMSFDAPALPEGARDASTQVLLPHVQHTWFTVRPDAHTT